MTVDFFEILTKVFIYGLPLVCAITFHEVAHGYVALKRGDTTAKRARRLSLNPVRHIDPFGTLILPTLLIMAKAPFVFGYAKPVPVNFSALKNPRYDMVLVALAGPATNIFLAISSALLVHTVDFLPSFSSSLLLQMLSYSILINVTLAIFNMIPLPPLDGGRVAVGLLPSSVAEPLARLERWGFVILILLFMILPNLLKNIGIQFDLFKVLLETPIQNTIQLIATMTGLPVPS